MDDRIDTPAEASAHLSRDLTEQDAARTGAPTVSGGQVGASMTGGGQLEDPEITDDKMGDPEGGPIVLENPHDREELGTEKEPTRNS